MKNLIVIFVISLFGLPIQAQKIVEKNIPLDAGNGVVVTMDYASDIEVKTWDKKDVYVKATVEIEEGKYNDYFQLDMKTKNGTLYIESDYGNLIKKKGAKTLKKTDESSNIIVSKKLRNNNGVDISSQYILYIPKNTVLRIVSSTGNTLVKEYVGDLSTELVSGDVQVENYQGNLRLKTVSGNIDVKVDNARLKAETTVGKVHLYDDITVEKEKSYVGEKVSGDFKNASYSVDLSSVSGDISLRKS